MLCASVLANGQNVVQIPTVFHVLWNHTTDNIPDSLIHQTLELVNNDFRRQNQDTILTPERFLPYAADTEIEFVLASFDPNGNLTNGVTNTQTDSTYYHYMHDNMKFDSTGGKNAWNPCVYLNVWVVPELGLGYAPIVDGVAKHPGGELDKDGVVVWHQMMELDSDGIFRGVTRLFAQYLDLYYISDASCMNVDSVSDTPISSWEPLGMLYTCDDTITTCSNGVDGDMFMNFMSNRFETCANIFTIGQKERMHTTLTNKRPGLIDASFCGLGIGETSLRDIEIFPNPTSETLTFQATGNGSWSIMDVNGRTLLHSSVMEGRNSLDVSSLSEGIYVLRLQSEKAVSTTQFVKN